METEKGMLQDGKTGINDAIRISKKFQ
jgi:hypothetical protein